MSHCSTYIDSQGFAILWFWHSQPETFLVLHFKTMNSKDLSTHFIGSLTSENLQKLSDT